MLSTTGLGGRRRRIISPRVICCVRSGGISNVNILSTCFPSSVVLLNFHSIFIGFKCSAILSYKKSKQEKNLNNELEHVDQTSRCAQCRSRSRMESSDKRSRNACHSAKAFFEPIGEISPESSTLHSTSTNTTPCSMQSTTMFAHLLRHMRRLSQRYPMPVRLGVVHDHLRVMSVLMSGVRSFSPFFCRQFLRSM